MTSTILALIALAIIIGIGVFWVRAIRAVQVPENRGAYLTAAAIALILSIVALSGNASWFGNVAAGLALFASALFCFTFAISAQKLGVDAIKVGDSLPAFSAVTASGENFDSTSLAGSPVLIKFFRGLW